MRSFRSALTLPLLAALAACANSPTGAPRDGVIVEMPAPQTEAPADSSKVETTPR